jgi:hypothetical protein
MQKLPAAVKNFGCGEFVMLHKRKDVPYFQDHTLKAVL